MAGDSETYQEGSEEGNGDGNEGNDYDINGPVNQAGNPAVGDASLHHLILQHVIDGHSI